MNYKKTLLFARIYSVYKQQIWSFLRLIRPSRLTYDQNDYIRNFLYFASLANNNKYFDIYGTSTSYIFYMWKWIWWYDNFKDKKLDLFLFV